jgi:Na+/H+-dicarboxylate symporter
MGLKTVIYYTLSTASAIVVGLTVVNVVRPGVGLELGSTSELPDGFSTSGQTLSEFLIRLVPDNVLAAMAQGEVLPVITFAILLRHLSDPHRQRCRSNRTPGGGWRARHRAAG